MKKLITVIALVVVLGSFVVVGMSGVGEVEDYDVIMHNVSSGDTAWDIVQVYNSPEVDTRKAVYYFRQENGQDLMLSIGSRVKVPVLKEAK
jgi:hypothetical protein